MSAEPTFHLEYYALLREAVGSAREDVQVRANDTGELFEALRARHRWPWRAHGFRVAVNGTFVDWSHTLRSGDTVTLLPPVSGG